MERRDTVVLSVPTAKAKMLLDSLVFRELKRRYRVLVFSYLAGRRDAVLHYGGPNVTFLPEVRPHGRLGGLLARLLEAGRGLGYQFGRRGDPLVGSVWRQTPRFRDIGSGRRRGVVRRALVYAVAMAFSTARAWRALVWLLGWRIVDRDVESLLARERPVAMVVSGQGQGTLQELVLGATCRRLGIPSIWLPVTGDDSIYNGYLMDDHRALCAWGPQMRRQLEGFHGVDPERIVNIGILMTRLQTELLAVCPGPDLRARLGIPPRLKIVTYFSVINSLAADTAPAVDALAAAVEDGRLRDTAIVLRTSPAEDPGELIERYKNSPHVWVQVGAWQEFDRSGGSVFADHARAIRECDVLVMGSLTSAIFQTTVWGIPVVLNSTELHDYPWDARRPSTPEAVDALGFFSAGLPVAHSLPELIELVQARLKDPELGRASSARIAAEWDYQDPQYAANVLALVDGTAEGKHSGLESARSV